MDPISPDVGGLSLRDIQAVKNQDGWPPLRATFHVPSDRCIQHYLILDLFVAAFLSEL